MFDHEFPGFEWEDWEFSHIHPEHDNITVFVSKVGGGTVGKNYTGHWHYCLKVDRDVAAKGSDLFTGSSTSHERAAEIALDFLLPS